jgi:predicted NBD/HSP70 family sugar kinase/DNA-binding transcriptional ArsR family regulator
MLDMEPAKPSLELLRSLTDEHVLRALMRQPRLTRAELAAATGVSKPTAGESVRRLVAAGLVADTGERTVGGRGRGRVGTYYALASDVGVALAVSIAPEGIVAECTDPYGAVISRAEQPIGPPTGSAPRDPTVSARPGPAGSARPGPAGSARPGPAVPARPGPARSAPRDPAPPGPPGPATPPEVAAALRSAVAAAVADVRGPVRLAVVSAADPVDRASGRMVHLPDSPFLLGDLDPVAVLAPLVAGEITVDNDVNWAARAERGAADRPDREAASRPEHQATARLERGAAVPDVSSPQADAPGAGGRNDFAYLYLGEGLGCAVVSDGEVRRGHTGLAGEIAHVLTTGPDGQAASLIDVFGQLGLRQPGATAIDTARLLADTTGSAPSAAGVRETVARAVAGAIAAVVALADPAEVVLGGPWGHHPELVAAIAGAVADLPRPVSVRAATLTVAPSLAGARADALLRLRAAIVTRAGWSPKVIPVP